MPEAPKSSRLDQIVDPETIAQLAGLYDRAVNALDPHSADRAEAERLFNAELRGLYDAIVTMVPDPMVEFRDFKRAIIVRCKKHLRATDRPSTP